MVNKDVLFGQAIVLMTSLLGGLVMSIMDDVNYILKASFVCQDIDKIIGWFVGQWNRSFFSFSYH